MRDALDWQMYESKYKLKGTTEDRGKATSGTVQGGFSDVSVKAAGPKKISREQGLMIHVKGVDAANLDGAGLQEGVGGTQGPGLA